MYLEWVVCGAAVTERVCQERLPFVCVCVCGDGDVGGQWGRVLVVVGELLVGPA